MKNKSSWRDLRDGCGTGIYFFYENHTCVCRWPECGGYRYHICLCGTDWETDKPTWRLWDRVKYDLFG